jgi:hypothetical protein
LLFLVTSTCADGLWKKSTGVAGRCFDEQWHNKRRAKGIQMLKMLLQHMATLLDADDLHLGDDSHALDQDDDSDETEDLDDDF